MCIRDSAVAALRLKKQLDAQGVKQLPGLVYNRLKDIPQVPVFTPCLLYTSRCV